MFLTGESETRELGRRRSASSFTLSAVVHVGIAAILSWPVAPLVLTPRLVAHGEGGNAMAAASVALYLPADVRVTEASTAQERPKTVAPHQEKQQASLVKQRSNALEVEH